MNRIAKTAVAGTAALAVGVPATLALAGPAQADPDEKVGTCRAATFELNIDREDGRFEVDGDLDDAKPGTRWRVALFQDGQRFAKVVRTADREGDIDGPERVRPDTAGSDTFTLKVKRIGGFKACSVTLVR